MHAPECLIRPYDVADRATVRWICAQTAWHGGPGGDHIPDDWLWAEFWTRYFTDAEPKHTWVVARTTDAQVVGYLSGTSDVRRPEHYVWRILPGIVRHVWQAGLLRRAAPRRALFGMLRTVLSGELRLPPGVAATYPATFHFNLLPEARGQGVGTRLFRTFEDAMRGLGVPGIHTQSLDVNRGVARFNERVGLTLVARRPTRAFQHIEKEPIAVLTWVKPLATRVASV
jgi:GNAT superfamily N-acetyltransferase